MAAIDPTYPLFPVFAIVCAALMLLVLTTSFIRQSWNLGVAILCFWLFWELLAVGVDAIVWYDNAEPKHFVWCDIVSHLQEWTYTVKPACTLIITRRLYKITSMRTVLARSRKERRVDLIVELGVGFGLPAFVSGVFYYMNQDRRFIIVQGYGCEDASSSNGFDVLCITSWQVILPLISIIFHCPRIICAMYCHRRSANEFLQNDDSITRCNYLRILALASVDILLTFPMGALYVFSRTRQMLEAGQPFYQGWDNVHSKWTPVAVPYSSVIDGPWTSFKNYLLIWSSPTLAIAIFSLVGLSAEARETYWRGICAACRLFRRISSGTQQQEDLGDIRFCHRSLTISEFGTRPSFVVPVHRSQSSVGPLDFAPLGWQMM